MRAFLSAPAEAERQVTAVTSYFESPGWKYKGVPLPTILIADDNDDLRLMLSQFLGANGFRALQAADGHEAVEAAARERPDLIVMDLGMPGMDGLSAVAEIRQRDPSAGTPILILSAYDRLEFRTEALNAGCAGFVTKPVVPSELLKTIRLLLLADEVDPPRPGQGE